MKYIRIMFPMLLLFIVLVGCAQGEDGAQKDSFLKQIYANYPELKDQPYEKDVVDRVVDGDTIVISSGDRVRLIGVNTPEVHGKVQFYGREASDFAKEKLDQKNIYLFQDVSNTDRYGRLLRYIFIEGDPVMFNETLVTQGYANASTYPPDVMFSEHFVSLEREAREKNIGLWAGEDAFTNKDNDNRNDHSKDSVIASTSCESPTIKGNINSKGEKIFHVPGGRYYEQTNPEEMFCTEEEAIAAGFRKSTY